MNQQLARFDANSLNRALVGFDNLFNDFEHRFANQINQSYPPYNILKYSEDSYAIEVAVTGFTKDEITVEVDQNRLVVKGERIPVENADIEYLYRGLASRNFVRSWTLAEHMVVGEGRIKNGVLTIEVTREVPEALKPRILKIKGE
jgi:molecular chaperone IbpA